MSNRPDRSPIPVGMSTILPETVTQVRHLEGVLLATLGRWGYQEIMPPTFEYLDVLAPGLEPGVIEACYKFVDRTTGRILLLRPDVTAQIARIVAMGMVEARLLIRLSYRTTVFRYEPEHAGRDREVFQVGAELIGVDDAAMDGEIVALMGDCLGRLGLSDFTISLGHVGFFKALVARAGLSPDGQKRAEHAAAKKDLPRLEEILAQERISARAAKGILEAPRLYGGEAVLERGRALAGRDPKSRAALDRLTQVYRLLADTGFKDRLVLDLGEFRGFDYYDGVVFDVFTEGVGCELGGGGRYNNLIGRFGQDLPSTGFAFDVDRLFRALERRGNGSPRARGTVLVSAPASQARRLFHVSGQLRDAGICVVHGTLRSNTARQPQAVLAEGRRLGAATAVLIGLPGQPPDETLVLTGCAEPRPPQRRRVPLKELVGILSKNGR
ncbi:MAG: ATP phosphoribosyltransferase regulatory subunit [Nitrospirota bacterium]|nr:ATP phosphoribosyltransferase regulatory subunit [Nitrospirota bacterium]